MRINNCVIDDSFSIDSFVTMTLDLVHKVRALFPNNKIYIFAVSWGSILSAKVLEKESKLVDGILVYGQIVKDVFFNEEVIAALDKTKLSKSKLEIIKAAKRDKVSPKELRLVSASIRKYAEGNQKNRSLWNEILQIDLADTLNNVQIPYVILQGDTDIVASASTVKTMVHSSSNSNLQCEMIENSGHEPGKEGMEWAVEKLGLLSADILID